jgi:hypothetical protein
LDPELDAIVRRCLEKSRDARFASMSELSAALSVYLEHRRQGVLPEPMASAQLPSASQPELLEQEKIRIPGVHARWPGVLAVLLVLGSAAAYQADRTGRVRLRDLTDGRLTPARLSADTPALSAAEGYQPALTLARGVFAAQPVRAANGTLALRAVPELARDGDEALPADAANAATSEAERVRRTVAYHEYLKNQDLTPLREVVPTLGTSAPPPESTDNPYP